MAYNYRKFAADQYDLSRFRGPAPGSKAPDFDLSLPDGRPARLLDFDADFLVLETGSVTCPLFQGRRPGMARLARAAKGVEFAVLYVREAHPGGTIRAHENIGEKRANARLLADADGETRRILVDDMEGSAHRAYGAYPNAVFIINRNGCVVWFSDWNNPGATAAALAALQAGRPAQVKAWFRPAPPPTAFRILRRAGKGALADFLRALPRLIWQNLILRNMRLRTGPDRAGRQVAPDTKC